MLFHITSLLARQQMCFPMNRLWKSAIMATMLQCYPPGSIRPQVWYLVCTCRTSVIPVWSSSFHGIVCDSQGWDAVWCFFLVQFFKLGFCCFYSWYPVFKLLKSLEEKDQKILKKKKGGWRGLGEGQRWASMEQAPQKIHWVEVIWSFQKRSPGNQSTQSSHSRSSQPANLCLHLHGWLVPSCWSVSSSSPSDW